MKKIIVKYDSFQYLLLLAPYMNILLQAVILYESGAMNVMLHSFLVWRTLSTTQENNLYNYYIYRFVFVVSGCKALIRKSYVQ